MNRDTLYSGSIVDHSKGATLTIPDFDTPYVGIITRVLVNAADPEDIKKANAWQDQLMIKAASAKPYTHPNYDQASYKSTYDALIQLGSGIPDYKRANRKKEDVSEVRHLIVAACGWGGLPEEEAIYVNVEPNLPVGAYQLTVKDVPVDAFWFGGDPKSVNYLHITEGWNYLVRFYQPHQEILDGTWTFPKVMPVK